MPAPVNVATYYRGTVWFNYKSYGWSESIEFNSANDADAIAAMILYVKHRMWTLPNTVTAVYARITKVPNIRYSIPLDVVPLVGKAETLTTADVTDMDSVERSAVFNFIVDNGGKAIRFFHGAPDAQITAQGLVPSAPAGAWIDMVTDPGDATANPGTWAVALKNVLSYIGQKTIVAGKQQTLSIGGVTKLGYVTNVVTGAISRAVRNKKVGRPFGLSHGKGPIR